MIDNARSAYVDELIKYYEESISPSLQEMSKTIVEIFSELLSEHAENVNLSYSNSVYKGQYFSFSPRIKTALSMKEKLFRNSSLLELEQKFPIVDEHKEELASYFISLKDVIGIKIVGELLIDVEKIFEVILKNREALITKGIQIKTELDDQPTEMKNGLEIYKLDCTLSNEEGTFFFELQIKSKLLSAWGDMEHQLFYKDYSISPVKTSVQNVMNKVGLLIKNVDDLLFTIRSSNGEYINDKHRLAFIETIQEKFKEPLENYLKLGMDYNLLDVCNVLFELEIIEKENIELSELYISVPADQITGNSDESVNAFIINKKKSFSLQILEYIFLVFLKEKNLYDGSQSSYREGLILFLNEYKKALFSLLSENSQVEMDDRVEEFNEIINYIFINANNDEPFLMSNSFSNFFVFYNRSLDFFEDSFLTDDQDALIHTSLSIFSNQNHEAYKTSEEVRRENFLLLLKIYATALFNEEYLEQGNAEVVDLFTEKGTELVEFLQNVQESFGYSSGLSATKDKKIKKVSKHIDYLIKKILANGSEEQ